MPEQPVDYERPRTPDERLEEFELWAQRDEPSGPLLIVAGCFGVGALLALYFAAKAVL